MPPVRGDVVRAAEDIEVRPREEELGETRPGADARGRRHIHPTVAFAIDEISRRTPDRLLTTAGRRPPALERRPGTRHVDQILAGLLTGGAVGDPLAAGPELKAPGVLFRQAEPDTRASRG